MINVTSALVENIKDTARLVARNWAGRWVAFFSAPCAACLCPDTMCQACLTGYRFIGRKNRK